LLLPGNWRVVDRFAPDPGATGGNFSVGYIVEHPSRGRAFLKAIDYSRAFGASDVPRALQALTEAFNFERDVLEKCRREGMNRVVHAVADGQIEVPGAPGIGTVNYLIFELAEADVRKFKDTDSRFAEAWALRALHHVATGLMQLHNHGIAHQDLKPSNVLIFEGASSKIGDLGRASYVGHAAPHDRLIVAGDPSYAPPELLYGRRGGDWQLQCQSCDMYLLGSLTFFLFSSVSATAAMLANLDPNHAPAAWSGSFESVLPYLRHAFNLAAEEFEDGLSDDFRSDIGRITRELCDPDPSHRGHPKARSSLGSPFSLERYVSDFNLLARRAEIGFYRTFRA
jgi:serine/threonine protein kinase